MTNTAPTATHQEAPVSTTLHCGDCTTDVMVAVTASHTHHPDSCPQVTVETVPASEIEPGDVVLDEEGHRLFAAFDVRWDADRSRYVEVWTATYDQEAGNLPERLYLVPVAPVTVRRRVGGPVTTYVAL